MLYLGCKSENVPHILHILLLSKEVFKSDFPIFGYLYWNISQPNCPCILHHLRGMNHECYQYLKPIKIKKANP